MRLNGQRKTLLKIHFTWGLFPEVTLSNNYMFGLLMKKKLIKFCRKCLIVFAVETAEEISDKVEAIEMELLEKEEMTLAEEQVESLLPEGLEGDELEELKAQLGKPVLVYAFRNRDGDIDEGKLYHLMYFSQNIHQMEWNL